VIKGLMGLVLDTVDVGSGIGKRERKPWEAK
jgi:hypothetical protein